MVTAQTQQLSEAKVFPVINLKWIRGWENIDTKRPLTYLCVGMRGTGKSSLLEAIGTRYSKIIDLFGSKDAEALAWCKPNSPYKDVLFIVGANVKICCKWPQVEVSKLDMQDFEQHQVIVTTRSFYNTSYEYFQSLQSITGLLWEKRTFWNDAWCVLIREAANLIYSRLQIVKDSNMAKSDFIQMLREARHSGLAVAVDTLRWTSLDKEIRDVSDLIFFKRLGAIGLPKDLTFIYRFILPYALQKLKQKSFVLLTNQGNLAIGQFAYPVWHKEEKENIMGELGIEIEYLGKDVEKGLSVSPLEHSKIVQYYHGSKSMGKTATMAQRSKSTVCEQIKIHNESIKEVGSCLACHNANSELEKTVLSKRSKLALEDRD